MTEMHLDLCIQSTNHLQETVASIKENIRILEVFLNSGLIQVDFSNKDLEKGKYFGGDNGAVPFLQKKIYEPLSDILGPSNRNHGNCCCMCRFRQLGADRENLNRSESRTSATTMSVSSNATHLKRKAGSGPRLIPRLNKTASLRREKILQKVGRKDSFL